MRLPTKGNLTKRGKESYRLQWKCGGLPYSVSFHAKTHNAAEKKREEILTAVRASILDGTHAQKYGNQPHYAPLIIKGDIRICDAWRYYLNSPRRPDTGESTLKQYHYQWLRFEKWIKKQYPNISGISQVNKFIAQEFIGEISSRCSANTFNKYVNLLRLVFTVALQDLDIAINPWSGITHRKNGNTGGRRELSPDEMSQINEVLDRRANGTELIKWEGGKDYTRSLSPEETMFAKEIKTLFIIGIYTGLRLGDCSLLEWKNIDMNNRRITLQPQKTLRTSGKRVIIPLLPELYHQLSSLNNDGTYVCPSVAHLYKHGSAELSDRIKTVFSQAGIQVHKEGTGKGTGKRAVVEVGFHSLRHTFVTRAKEAGVDDATVRAIIGWGSPAMARIYTHISEGHITKQIAKMAAPHAKELSGMSNEDIQAAIIKLQQEMVSRLTQ